ncbi:Uncharacterised protein [Citrobacter koseri]|uniref:Uncharacterized protein n=1 Tax=Citrobacter koseri TaxID=545 RepID=A0A2X2VC59_CITKO|nr:Uncharacterised protein [Citrobacter koseri]
MKKYFVSAAALLFCSQAFAAPASLLLAITSACWRPVSAKVSIFSKDVALPDGAQKMVVKFDSPANPESVNNNRRPRDV